MNTEKYSKPTEMSEPLEIRLKNDVNKKLPSWNRKNIRTLAQMKLTMLVKLALRGKNAKAEKRMNPY